MIGSVTTHVECLFLNTEDWAYCNVLVRECKWNKRVKWNKKTNENQKFENLRIMLLT